MRTVTTITLPGVTESNAMVEVRLSTDDLLRLVREMCIEDRAELRRLLEPE